MSYHFWYERNVLNGNTDTLKVEIHLRTFSTAARESGEELETVKSCYKNSYVPFAPDSIKGQEHEYVVAPIDDEEVGMDEEDIAALVNWHCTEDWFPEKVKDAKKVKSSAAAEASNEANEEVNGEVKVEQGNELDDGDDSSELSGLITGLVSIPPSVLTMFQIPYYFPLNSLARMHSQIIRAQDVNCVPESIYQSAR
jgi:hypothetical protein